jgi:hypothetical protein
MAFVSSSRKMACQAELESQAAAGGVIVRWLGPHVPGAAQHSADKFTQSAYT